MAFIFGQPKFILSFPDNWKDETMYSFKGPEDSGVQHGLLVTVDDEPGTGDMVRYAKDRINALKNTLTGAEFLKEEEKQLSADYPAYEVVYKWIPSEGKVLFQKQVWVLVDGVVYNLTASFSKKTIKTIGKEVDAIIDSLRKPSSAAPVGAPAKKISLTKMILPIKKGRPAIRKPAVKKKPPVAKKPQAAKKPSVKKKPPRVKIKRISKK